MRTNNEYFVIRNPFRKFFVQIIAFVIVMTFWTRASRDACVGQRARRATRAFESARVVRRARSVRV